MFRQHVNLQELLAGILREGIEEQIWSSYLDPGAAAATIITLMEGASLWAVTSPERGEQMLAQFEKWLRIA